MQCSSISISSSSSSSSAGSNITVVVVALVMTATTCHHGFATMWPNMVQHSMMPLEVVLALEHPCVVVLLAPPHMTVICNQGFDICCTPGLCVNMHGVSQESKPLHHRDNATAKHPHQGMPNRSEERRVGKECRL